MNSQPANRGKFWRRFYDLAAFAYDFVLDLADRLHVGAEGRLRREYVAALPLAGGARALDLGCGTAANRPFLPGDTFYVGVDISRGMLRHANGKAKRLGWQGDFVLADARALPFRQASFGAILAVGVLQHVAHPEQVIEQCRYVALPGANFFVADEMRAWKRLRFSLNATSPQGIGDYFVVCEPL